ncbi:hypothetical protein [Nocardia gipuzkoensis]
MTLALETGQVPVVHRTELMGQFRQLVIVNVMPADRRQQSFT